MQNLATRNHSLSANLEFWLDGNLAVREGHLGNPWLGSLFTGKVVGRIRLMRAIGDGAASMDVFGRYTRPLHRLHR